MFTTLHAAVVVMKRHRKSVGNGKIVPMTQQAWDGLMAMLQKAEIEQTVELDNQRAELQKQIDKLQAALTAATAPKPVVKRRIL